MKLAEALIARADLQNKTAQIKRRITQSAKVREGDEPIEDAAELLRQYDTLMSDLETLVTRINRTNAAAELDDGVLVDAIAKRDSLKARINTYRELWDEVSITRERGGYDRSDIKLVRCLDIAKLREEIDAMSKQYRELDTKMQKCNWTIDLL